MSGSVKINAPVKETVTEEKSEEPVFSPSPVPEKEEKANEPEEKAETSVHEKIINLRELRQCVGAVVDVDGKQMRVSVYNRDRGLVDRFTVKRR